MRYLGVIMDPKLSGKDNIMKKTGGGHSTGGHGHLEGDTIHEVWRDFFWFTLLDRLLLNPWRTLFSCPWMSRISHWNLRSFIAKIFMSSANWIAVELTRAGFDPLTSDILQAVGVSIASLKLSIVQCFYVGTQSRWQHE